MAAGPSSTSVEPGDGGKLISIEEPGFSAAVFVEEGAEEADVRRALKELVRTTEFEARVGESVLTESH